MNIEIKTYSGNHSDGTDKNGNFVATYYYFASLYIKDKDLEIPMGYVMTTNRHNEVNTVVLNDMTYSYYTKEYQQAEEEAKKIFINHNINELELKKLVVEKLAEKYDISEKLQQSLI